MDNSVQGLIEHKLKEQKKSQSVRNDGSMNSADTKPGFKGPVKLKKSVSHVKVKKSPAPEILLPEEPNIETTVTNTENKKNSVPRNSYASAVLKGSLSSNVNKKEPREEIEEEAASAPLGPNGLNTKTKRRRNRKKKINPVADENSAPVVQNNFTSPNISTNELESLVVEEVLAPQELSGLNIRNTNTMTTNEEKTKNSIIDNSSALVVQNNCSGLNKNTNKLDSPAVGEESATPGSSELKTSETKRSGRKKKKNPVTDENSALVVLNNCSGLNKNTNKLDSPAVGEESATPGPSGLKTSDIQIMTTNEKKENCSVADNSSALVVINNCSCLNKNTNKLNSPEVEKVVSSSTKFWFNYENPTELEILLKNIKDFEPKVPVEYNDECLDPIMINDETSGNSENGRFERSASVTRNANYTIPVRVVIEEIINDSQLTQPYDDPIEINRKSIYVGNINISERALNLFYYFSKYGAIKQVVIIHDKFTNYIRPYAFIEFAYGTSVSFALEMNMCFYNGRRVRIQEKRNCAPGIRTNPQEEVIVDTMVSMPMLISAPSASSSVPITYLQGSMEIPVALKYIHYSQ